MSLDLELLQPPANDSYHTHARRFEISNRYQMRRLEMSYIRRPCTQSTSREYAVSAFQRYPEVADLCPFRVREADTT